MKPTSALIAPKTQLLDGRAAADINEDALLAAALAGDKEIFGQLLDAGVDPRDVIAESSNASLLDWLEYAREQPHLYEEAHLILAQYYWARIQGEEIDAGTPGGNREIRRRRI